MSQYWNSFREPEVAIADDFDLLQAINSNPHETLYETPSFGEETSFSDAALSNVCCGYDAVEHRGMNDTLAHNLQTVQTRKGVDDSFMTLPTLTESDNDWFNSIFDDQGLVYNDKNLGETATQPCIKSEHSYSANNVNRSSPLSFVKMDESDTAIFNTHGSTLDLTQKAQLIHAAATATQPHCIKTELPDNDPLLTAMTSTDTSTTLTRPATIILATTTSSTTQEFSNSPQAVFPTTTVQIKTEPMDAYETLQEQTVNLDTVIMPPTPPSSAGSDSDGSQSPQRSAPNSPQRQSPMPQSGVLILTEEEKRTLISEGYPIPSKLPLTKQEEKNLKKVRRKIKNKISAQESRRKKKEYLEALEKRVEAFNHENSDLKKKVESLESNNRSLLGQLQKLQALVSKVPRTAAASATQTGTVLMVLVLCFAVFLGGSGVGPSSLNVGYSGVGPAALSFQQPGPLRPQPNMGPGPARVEDTADDYTTPNLKSRVLMALSREEPEDWCDEYRPLFPWERDQSCSPDTEPGFNPSVSDHGPVDPGVDDIMPSVFKAAVEESTQQSIAVVTVAVGSENATESVDEYQAIMHPDIAVAPNLGHLGNFTADLETA